MTTPVLIEAVEASPLQEDHDRILALLNADNRRRSDIVDLDDIAVLLRHPETKEIVGGLWAEDDFSWVFVKYLVVPEACRGHGIGTRLVAEAEHSAGSGPGGSLAQYVRFSGSRLLRKNRLRGLRQARRNHARERPDVPDEAVYGVKAGHGS